MKPIDFRNETFEQVRGRISGQREAVFAAWIKHGPCTTEELAQRSGLSVLNVRPRTTELVETGFVRLDERQTSKGEGVYRACTPQEAAATFRSRQIQALNPQAELPLS